MTRLKQSDLKAFSHALEILYADTEAATLPKRILATVRTLFDCDFASFSLLDLRQGKWHFSRQSPVVREWPGAEVYQRFLRDDPAAAHIMRTRTRRAVKISDFCSLREYRASKVYAEVFRPVGCDRRLGFAVQGTSPVTLATTLNRKRLDFTDEERMMLDCLRPHLLRANSHAHADRLAVAARLQAESVADNSFGLGLIEVDARGKVRWTTPRAEVLLGVYFPQARRQTAGRRLPVLLERQARRESSRNRNGPPAGQSLIAATDICYYRGPEGRRLKVRLAGEGLDGSRQLLLEEVHHPALTHHVSLALGLTEREGEILHWVAEAKTNREISEILGNSEKTVGKHLENVYHKLQVTNRAAALRVIVEARGDL